MKITDNFISESDEFQINERGITKSYIFHQKFIIQRGTVHLDILNACVKGKGIIVFDEFNKDFYIKYFLEHKRNFKILKFIPSSGAASRMFSDLDINAKSEFFNNLNKFAFYNNLYECFQKKGLNLKSLLDSKNYDFILNFLLNEEGLNYINLPKALIPFHIKNNEIITAFEEQIEESKDFISDINHISHFHFTISKQNELYFTDALEEIKKKKISQNSIIDVSFSIQSISSETIAVDSNGDIVRDSLGSILFRPGGHGALLQNLNEAGKNYDIIFVKNIDNISTSKYHKYANDNFSLLAGYLLYLQKMVFSYLNKLTSNCSDEEVLNEIIDFCIKKLVYIIPEAFYEMSFSEKKEYIIKRLNRPLRVCGLVYNEGETGGLPFLVRDKAGEISLQIVEGAEIDKSDIKNQMLIKESLFFNPVFMALSMKNFKGEYFDITHYTSKDAFIISEKSYKGKKIKVLEHPGLWNGGMYYWNTVFIEVTNNIFAPVKTIMDLLKEEHKN